MLNNVEVNKYKMLLVLTASYVDIVIFMNLQKRQVSLRSVLFHLGILLHALIQSLLKLKRKKKRRDIYYFCILVNATNVQRNMSKLTSNCAKLTELVLRCHFKAIF